MISSRPPCKNTLAASLNGPLRNPACFIGTHSSVLVSGPYQAVLTLGRFKLLLPAASESDSEGDSEALIRTKAFENGVLALPGTVFLPNGRKTAYVRASFSLLDESQVDEALKRLREVIIEARK